MTTLINEMRRLPKWEFQKTVNSTQNIIGMSLVAKMDFVYLFGVTNAAGFYTCLARRQTNG
jgi:hypothetical protein